MEEGVTSPRLNGHRWSHLGSRGGAGQEHNAAGLGKGAGANNLERGGELLWQSRPELWLLGVQKGLEGERTEAREREEPG